MMYYVAVVIVWGIIIAIPIIAKIFNNQRLADLIKLKSNDTQKVLFVFEGDIFTSATEEDFRQIVDAYDGDVYFVKYPHDNCAMDYYCQQIINCITSKYYSYIDIIGVSVSSQAYATLYKQLRRFPVEIHFWAVFPLNSNIVQNSPRRLMFFAALLLDLAKIALGVFGQIPFICRRGIRYSFGEIIEQFHLATHDRPFWLCRTSIWHKPDDSRSCWGYCSNLAHGIIDGIIIAKNDKLISDAKVVNLYKNTTIAFVNSREVNDKCMTALHKLGLLQ